MMSPVLASFLAVTIAIGAFFLLVASVGLLRFTDATVRNQTVKLAATLGIPLLAFSCWIYFSSQEQQHGVIEPLAMLILWASLCCFRPTGARR